MNNQKDRNCQNCRYLVKHYANFKGYYYQVNGCSHCVNPKLSLKESNKRITGNTFCEFWEDEEIQIEERREHIIETLKRMEKTLKELTQILKDDYNKK